MHVPGVREAVDRPGWTNPKPVEPGEFGVTTPTVEDSRTRGRRILLVAGLSIAAALALVVWRTGSRGSALDLDGQSLDPLAVSRGKGTVLIFTRSDCPISNRYAPEVQRLADRFAPLGIAFWLVYVDPDEEPQAIRRHLEEYGYGLPALRDTEHRLVRLAGAKVTPEAAVYASGRELVYGGRIDNRYFDYDRKRLTPTKRDLEEALEALLAGREPEVKRSPAVGCYIADLIDE